MKTNSNTDLIKMAKGVAKHKRISDYVSVGGVGCALITDKNNIYVGKCIDTTSGMGFCAEHAAIANMLANGEYKIKRIVAVKEDGAPLPPCGRCREFMYRITKQDGNVKVMIGKNKEVKLIELLPSPWSL